MAKVWADTVYSSFEEDLIRGFVRVLSSNREQCIAYFNEDKSATSPDAEPSEKENAFPVLHFYAREKAPRDLYLKLMYSQNDHSALTNRLRQTEREARQSQINGRVQPSRSAPVLAASFAKSYFANNPDQEVCLLTTLANALLDLSLNEISVHYVKTTQVELGSPYLNLETEVLYQTDLYYRSKFETFLEHPGYFGKFLQSDRNTLGRIVRERSKWRHDEILQSTAEAFVRSYIMHNVFPLFEERWAKRSSGARSRGIRGLDPMIRSICGKVLFEVDCERRKEKEKNRQAEAQGASQNKVEKLVRTQSTPFTPPKGAKRAQNLPEVELRKHVSTMSSRRQRLGEKSLYTLYKGPGGLGSGQGKNIEQSKQLPLPKLVHSQSQPLKKSSPLPLTFKQGLVEKLQRLNSGVWERQLKRQESFISNEQTVFQHKNEAMVNFLADLVQENGTGQITTLPKEIIVKLEVEAKHRYRQRDCYIKEVFEEKNIPFEMDGTDRVFYDLCENPSMELIENTYKKFQRILKEKIEQHQTLNALGPQNQNINDYIDSSDLSDDGVETLSEYNDGSRYPMSINNDMGSIIEEIQAPITQFQQFNNLDLNNQSDDDRMENSQAQGPVQQQGVLQFNPPPQRPPPDDQILSEDGHSEEEVPPSNKNL